jgi:hypothetical protein
MFETALSLHLARSPKMNVVGTRQRHRLFILRGRQCFGIVSGYGRIYFRPPPKDHPLMFTSDQKWTIAVLLKLLDDMNAPPLITRLKLLLNGHVRPRTTIIHFIHRADCRAPKMRIIQNTQRGQKHPHYDHYLEANSLNCGQ